ncbi:MAG: spermidine/putrescine ABC transporter substrate-binding protein, partial [Gemmatimonadota bacterium]
NYASNEEMFNKLKAGGSGQFDVIFPSDYMVNILASQDMIQQVDKKKLPHWENLESFWVNTAPYDPDPGRYSVPYFWGTSGIAWNAEMFSESVRESLPFASWDAMWDERFKGQMTMLNDMRETIGASLKRLGYSLNSKKESEINEAKEELIKQKKLLKTYDSVNMAENLINQNASPIHSWSGSPFQAYWELYKEGEGSPIGYRVPEEGGVVWIDTSCVTKKAKHLNAAHAFINFTLNAKMHAEIANYLYYPSPNAAAKEYINEDMLNNPRIYPPESTFESLEFIRNLGQATTAWSEAWTEIQNA